ncbi:MAG TPA: hypothetical protein VGN16_03705 [Acidobacteriaceae bacterium]|jgi:hypothetical protein
MKNFSEEDLIAYHLNELPRLRAWMLRRELESNAELASESEAIAETLRAFRDAPSPRVDDAMLERTWNSVRPSLAVLSPQPKRRFVMWSAVAASTVAALGVVALLLPMGNRTPQADGTVAANHAPVVQRMVDTIAHIRGVKPAVRPVNDRPGPLTYQPVDAVAADPQMAAYLDSAERTLTEVSHERGAPSEQTRSQVHDLLLQNAVYRQSAQEHGDLAAAGVMDDLGRVLVSLDAEPIKKDAHDPDAFRLEMSIGSVLFDLRILHPQTSSKTAE